MTGTSEEARAESLARARAAAQARADATGRPVLLVVAPAPTPHGPAEHIPYWVDAAEAVPWELPAGIRLEPSRPATEETAPAAS